MWADSDGDDTGAQGGPHRVVQGNLPTPRSTGAATDKPVKDHNVGLAWRGVSWEPRRQEEQAWTKRNIKMTSVGEEMKSQEKK